MKSCSFRPLTGFMSLRQMKKRFANGLTLFPSPYGVYVFKTMAEQMYELDSYEGFRPLTGFMSLRLVRFPRDSVQRTEVSVPSRGLCH